MLISLSLGALTGVLFFFLHFLLLHWNLTQKRVASLFFLFLSCLIFYCFVFAVSSLWRDQAPGPALRWIAFLNGGFVYLAVVGIYLGIFFYAIRRSVSIRVLIELKKAGPAGLSREDLDRVYSMEEMVSGRLKTMVQAGWLREEEGVFTATKNGRRLSSLLSFINRTLILNR